jgi:citrate lyase beta subunit/acyl dehydratase
MEMASVQKIRRTSLIVPGGAVRMLARAAGCAADLTVFDLEDAVADDHKDEARRLVMDALGAPEWRRRDVAVRINAAERGEQEADLAMCAASRHERLTIVVPKVQRPSDVAAAARIAPVHALIETPEGLLAASEIAALEAVEALVLGYADLAATLGRRNVEVAEGVWSAVQEAVLVAARAGGALAIDGPFFHVRDRLSLEIASRSARDRGFDGKWAIHPEQIAPINRAFDVTPEERTWAEDVRDAVGEASRSGSAVGVVGGAMVDPAMVRRAARLLAHPVPTASPRSADGATTVEAPYFDDLPVGRTFRAPGVTITDGHATLHQSIIGDRLRLALDAELFEAVAGVRGVLAHPMLVGDIAIGQSTAPSGRVLGNLFYRGLGMRPVGVGTTLRTTTEVVARRATSGDRGIVALRVRTVDGSGREVLDFWRAPLLPSRPGAAGDDADDLRSIGHDPDPRALVPGEWNLDPLRADALGPLVADLRPGTTFDVEAAETITSAPELARLTLNVAHTHTDATAGAYGSRLVYGGHVIGVAFAHVTRALPDLATILTWDSCAHLGPAFEGDRLHTRVEVVDIDSLTDGGLLRLRVTTSATEPGGLRRDVLDWRVVVLMP